MKVLASISVMLLLAGCSHDDSVEEIVASDSQPYQNATLKSGSQTNVYTETGILYQEILDAYYLLPASTRTVQQVIEQGETIAMLHPDFIAMALAQGYNPLSAVDVGPYIGMGGNNLALLSHEYSSGARLLLIEIAEELEDLKFNDESYSAVSDYLNGMQKSIENSNLTAVEKNALLITTTLLNNAYDNDRKRRRRDRDWEWMTGHYTATANAALESLPQAIMMSFTTDVYQN